MAGKFFEDWEVGAKYVTPTRTMTEADVVMFAAMTGDYNELHTSEEYMKNAQFGRRIGHGLLGLAVSHGLLFRTGFTEGTAIAFLGVDGWRFMAPFFIGDTIHVSFEVAEVKVSKSKSDRGVVKLHLEIVNQNGTVVQSGFKTIMFKRRDAEEAKAE